MSEHHNYNCLYQDEEDSCCNFKSESVQDLLMHRMIYDHHPQTVFEQALFSEGKNYFVDTVKPFMTF